MTRLLILELRRLSQSPLAWLAALGTLAAPLAGYGLFPFLSWTTMATIYLANPIILGTLAGCVLFVLLALYELDRGRRQGVDVLAHSAASPLRLTVLKVLALVLWGLCTAALGFLLYLPFTAWRLGLVFSLGDYALCWFLVCWPALAFGVLAAGAAWLVLGRGDVSALAVGLLLVLSRTGPRAEDPWWQWSLPKFPALSDDFGNTFLFRVIAYSRLVWLCLLAGGFLLALLCLRRYGRGLWGSLAYGLRRGLPMLLAGGLLLVCGGLLVCFQPYLDHSPVDWLAYEDPDCTLEGVDITGTALTLDASDTLLGRLSGHGVYHLENRTGAPQVLHLELNAGLTIRAAQVNGQAVDCACLGDDYIAACCWTCPLPADRDITLEVDYGGLPRIWNVNGGTYLDPVVSGRYADLNSTALAPVPQANVKDEETPVTLDITLPEALTPVASGTFRLLSEEGGNRVWRLEDTGRSTKAVYAGDFVKADLEGGGIPMEFYYSRKHRAQLESLDAIASMEAAVAYCTEHYGPRTFEAGKPFKILQLTEFQFGGFASGNLSGTLEESFTVRNLQDQEKGASGAEVLAHEIIHQWWGLGVMLQDPSNDWWTSEGLTTYTTYRLMEDRYGPEYARTHYLDLWEAAVADSRENFYVRHPEYLDRLPEAFAADIQASIQSVNWYSGTALMLKRAEDLLGGPEAMDAVLSRLYQEGGTELGPEYITLGDFLTASGLTKEALEYA